MRILILASDYPEYLLRLYKREPGLSGSSFAGQMARRRRSPAGIASSYVRAFTSLGHQTQEVYINNVWAQGAWARERGLDAALPSLDALQTERASVTALKRALQPYRDVLYPIARRLGLVPAPRPEYSAILEAQIEEFDPDIVLNQHLAVVEPALLQRIKRKGRLIVAQCGVALPPRMDLSGYDFAISLIPSVVEEFRRQGLRAMQSHLAFDPYVLQLFGPESEKDIAVSFVGGLSSDHAERIAFLEAVVTEYPIQLWLSNFKGIRANSPLHMHYQGEAWDTDMYNILRRSRITMNSHIDAAKGMAGNLRLYEATGMGTFLLTDDLPNLASLFTPGIEVATYSSVSDCLRKIKTYLADDGERDAIAKRGQVKTLSVHTYQRRVSEFLDHFAMTLA